MDTIKLSVLEREETGNGPARRLRALGRVPGVTYAKGEPATVISVALEDFKAAMAHGHNIVLELDFGKGEKAAGGTKAKDKSATAAKSKGREARYAVVKQIQFHPTKRQVLHVDLHEVDLAVEIEALVAIETVGTAAGLVDGGIMEWDRREVLVRALPGDVPPSLQLDVTGLEIGHHLTVEALSAPAGVVIVDDPEVLLVALVPPRVEAPAAVEEEEEEEEAVEPEVVGSPTPEAEE